MSQQFASASLRPWAYLFTALVFIASATHPGTVAAFPSYLATDLGTLGGDISQAFGINSHGQVAGYAYTIGNGFSKGVFYDGSLHDVGTINGYFSVAYAINSLGHVVGDSSVTTDYYPRSAFFYDGTIHDLGSLGGSESFAYGINDDDQVVGESALTGNAEIHAFLHDGTMHDLGTLGGSRSVAYAINNDGLVVGNSTTQGAFVTRAFLYDGTMRDLGTLGGDESFGHAISANGYVAGSAVLNDYNYHAFFYDGTMHDVGTLGGPLSAGFGVNSSGIVVGRSDMPDAASSHAFLYSSVSGIVDLNSLIDVNTGWDLWSARAINDAGQITGYGLINAKVHAFLLTPVPEPTTIGMLVGGVIVCIFRRRIV